MAVGSNQYTLLRISGLFHTLDFTSKSLILKGLILRTDGRVAAGTTALGFRLRRVRAPALQCSERTLDHSYLVNLTDSVATPLPDLTNVAVKTVAPVSGAVVVVGENVDLSTSTFVYDLDGSLLKRKDTSGSKILQVVPIAGAAAAATGD